MGHFESVWIERYTKARPLFYRRYVDDIFAVFNKEHEANDFFEYLNIQHPNIKFTIENIKDNKIVFLDILVDNSSKLLLVLIIKKLIQDYLPTISVSHLHLIKLGLSMFTRSHFQNK